MHNPIKKSICVFLCFIMTFALGGCAGKTQMNEKNITKTVEKVEVALKNFDSKTLEKYVSSKTLQYILSFAKDKQQFEELGRSMFEKLEIEIKSVDAENGKVTLLVKNRDMQLVAANFAYRLTSNYSTFQLLTKLKDDAFLDESLSQLNAEISEAVVPDNPTEITLTVEKGKKNLVLVFDEAAEDAVSGGAMSAITSVVKV